MQNDKLIDQNLNAWQVNERINAALLHVVSTNGLKAVPHGSKGRNISLVYLQPNSSYE